MPRLDLPPGKVRLNMCRVVAREFQPAVEQASVARHWLIDVAARWKLPDDPFVALLGSELISNAIVHAATPFTLTFAVAEGVAEVAATDTGGGDPRPQSLSNPRAASGRGLAMIEALADEWGTAWLGAGKQVWFRRTLAPGWAHLAACPCGGALLTAARLASGRAAVTVAGPWDLET